MTDVHFVEFPGTGNAHHAFHTFDIGKLASTVKTAELMRMLHVIMESVYIL